MLMRKLEYGGSRMWGSLTALETVATVTFWVTVVSGSVGVIAGASLTIVSDRIAKLTRTAADLEIAAARNAAAVANQRAEEARTEAAKVNEHLHKSQEMRRLTKPQAEALKPLLKSPLFQTEPKPNLRVSTVSDAEAESFALELQKFFASCGVNVYPTIGGGPNEHFQLAEHSTGLALGVKDLQPCKENQPFVHFERLAQAVGLNVSVECNPDLGNREAVLYVMRKPPA